MHTLGVDSRAEELYCGKISTFILSLRLGIKNHHGTFIFPVKGVAFRHAI